MINIDKRIKMLDPLKGTVGRLDERLAAVETILMQKNEREKMQLQRTYEAVIDIQKNLPLIIEEMKNEIITKLSVHEPPAEIVEPEISKKDFENLGKEVVDKIEKVTISINKLENGLTKMKDNTKHLKDLNDKSSDNLENLKQHINDNKQLLSKYDKKLAEYNNKIPEITNTNSREQDEFKHNILKALDEQKSNLKEALVDLKNIQDKMNQLPQKQDLSESQSTSLNKLETLTKDMSSSYSHQNASSDNILRAIQDIDTKMNNAQQDTIRNINGLTEYTTIMMKALANSNTALDGQKIDVSKILQNVENIQDKVDQLPYTDDISIVQHTILKKLEEISNELTNCRESSIVEEIGTTLNNINNDLNRSHRDTTKNLNSLSEITNNLVNQLSKNLGTTNQESDVTEILTDVRNIKSKVNQLPQKYDLISVQNKTLNKLEQISNEISSLSYHTILQEIRNTLDDVNQNINKTHDDSMRNLNDLSEITGTLADSFANNYGKIRNEIQALSKLDQIMIKTGDDVVDTKRRVEYGVHQVMGEVAKQLKESTKNINQALSDRFDLFEATILDEDSGALANISSKIENDIQQVWRQIGIMYQQISTSSDTLNHLQNLTDAYVNGSLGAMNNMKGKVGQITGRITEVDENLNYLLGRLSLVTQEFGHIKIGLSTALDQIRDNFHAVQEQLKDNGPGPHKILSNQEPPKK